MTAIRTFIVAAIGGLALLGLGQAAAAPNAVPSNTSPPTISGTPQEGQTLTASTGTWTGQPTHFDYQWQRCDSAGSNCSLISGATSQAYTLVSADVGRRIRVVVTARNADGQRQASSSPTAVVTRLAQNAPRNTSRPSISGTAEEGRTLTVSNGGWSGTQPISFRYQWLRCDATGGACVNVSGATSRTYTLVAADVGRRMRALVTATNSAGAASALSNASGRVDAAPATAPRNTGAPTIAGTAREGEVLTASPGTWTGTQPLTFSYQWLRCDSGGGSCAAISGATGQTYTVTSADAGETLRVQVTARNSAGSASVQSLATSIVGEKAPSGVIKLPNGRSSVPASSVALPARLVIDGVRFTPNPLRSRLSTITGRIHVSDTRGNVVRDVRVLLLGLPYNWLVQPGEVATGVDGWATVQFHATRNVPRRGAIVMFVRARKLGDNLLAGVSTRRLVQMRVELA